MRRKEAIATDAPILVTRIVESDGTLAKDACARPIRAGWLRMRVMVAARRTDFGL